MTVTLELDKAAALVVFELLTASEGIGYDFVLSDSDKCALAQLQGSLESALVEPFSPNYQAVIDHARASLLDRFGGSPSNGG
jgi:hypothetical protein